MNRLYKVVARVCWSEDGWDTSEGVPIFFLDPHTQGIVDEAHALKIAEKIINPTGKLEVHADVVLIDTVSGWPI